METRSNKIDWISLSAIIFILVILGGLLINPANIIMEDFWYHLSIARQILEQKTFITWDHATFQPFGRPHYYPPLLHLVIAFAGVFTDNFISLGQTLGTIFYTLFLFAFWYFLKTLWNNKVALIGLLIVTTSSTLSLTFFSLLPSSISLIPILLFLICFLKRKNMLCIILSSIVLYLYTPFYIYLMLGALIFSYLNKAFLKSYLKILVFSILIGLPWLVYFLSTFPSVDFSAVEAGFITRIGIFSHYSINIVFYALAFFGHLPLKKKP